MKSKSKVIIYYSLIACIILFATENIFQPSFLIQTIQKISLFVIIPLFILYFQTGTFGKFGKLTKQSLIYGIGLGLIGLITIFLCFNYYNDVIEWSSIQKSITNRGINKNTFVLVFLYIMLGNSLVEEYFFRVVIFNTLEKYYKLRAYLISSIAFSLYHITIFGTWVHGYLLLISLLGVFVWGLFFAWLYKKTSGIWGAWFFHITADIAILTIGYYKFFS